MAVAVLAQSPPVIGVLALQGDVSEHVDALRACGAATRLVRTQSDLEGVEGLVIPGGESTTVGKLLARFELLEPLRTRIREGLPTYGTCTGMILLADEIEEGIEDQVTLGGMDVRVRRNAFGRQRDSFEALISISVVGGEPFPAVFIRAPEVISVGPGVDVLARHHDRIVAVRQGSLLASAFHPELTRDPRMHAYFVEMVREAMMPDRRTRRKKRN
jgi:5'-phosphate synthase pdxT subunit